MEFGEGVGGVGLLGDVETCGETVGWSSVAKASALGDSETTRVIRCLRWHRLRTSSETDTSAEIKKGLELKMSKWEFVLYSEEWEAKLTDLLNKQHFQV